jgi:hypothetical protein
MPPTALQHYQVGDELHTAIRLIKTGLRELQRLTADTDFFHLPILLLSSGFERMLKIAICCHELETTGEYPSRSVFPRGKRGHDLVVLLDDVTKRCFSDAYLARISTAKADLEFLRNDDKLRKVVRILSDFGQSARYYNLNVVLNEADPGPSPAEEWQTLETEVLQEDPAWVTLFGDLTQSDTLIAQINTNLTAHCERLARSLSRLFTLGALGSQAEQISPYTFHFLKLRDDQLGETDYESVDVL